ncbi:DKNYY domain-containing protein, partial [bacterium]|nr:DKNYY domain-containing protein [bacterium]
MKNYYQIKDRIVSYNNTPIKEAHLDTFKILSPYYAIDKNTVYRGYEDIRDSDP